MEPGLSRDVIIRRQKDNEDGNEPLYQNVCPEMMRQEKENAGGGARWIARCDTVIKMEGLPETGCTQFRCKRRGSFTNSQ